MISTAIASLLLFGAATNANSMGSDLYLTEHELEQAFTEFYNVQSRVAFKCDTEQCRFEYLDFFNDKSIICVPDEFHVFKRDDIKCRNKYDYGQLLFKDGMEYYKEIKDIFKWELDEITDIQIENAYDKYGHNEYNGDYKAEKVFTVTAKYENEYVKNHCQYKACGTEKFEIYKNEIMSYKVLDIFIKSEECKKEMSWPTYKPTAKPTQNWPTAKPTKKPTPKPTENWPTPKPTAKPTTAWPTNKPTKKPTIAWSTKGPTKKPTISWTTTKSPTTIWETESKHKECNYLKWGAADECDHGYTCEKKNQHSDCNNGAYCPGICVKIN